MKKFSGAAIILFALSMISFNTSQGDFCGIRNFAYKDGEMVTFKVFYSTLGAYIGAGEATFTTTLERYNGKTVYHHVVRGKRIHFSIIFSRYVTDMKVMWILQICSLINSYEILKKAAIRNIIM